MEANHIKLLLIEDNSGDARLIREALRAAGGERFDLQHADRLATGFARLDEGGFQLVLLDLSLPDSHGLDTVARTHAQAPDVPIVVLTSLDDQALALKALEMGAHDYLVKGDVDGRVLNRVIRYAIERQQTRTALRLSEQRFRALIEHSADAIALTDAQGTVLYLSPSGEQIEGYAPEALAGRTAAEQTHPDDLERRKQVYGEVLANPGKPVYVQWRRRHKDGTWRWLEGVGTNLLDVPGVNGIVTNYRDITERKQAEEKLRESEERYRRFFENMHETFVIQEVIADDAGKPIDLRYLDVNPAAERILGKTRSEIVGRTRRQLSGQPDPEGVEMASRVASTGTPFHMVRYSSGFGGWFESFTYSLGSGIVATLALDITERKQVEAALQRAHDELEFKVQERTAALSQANALLQMMMDYIPDQIYFKDAQSRFIRNSRSQADLMGLSDPAEVVGKTDFDFFPHAQRSYDEEQELMKSGQPLVDLEEYVVWPDGRATWISTTKAPLRDKEGQIMGTFGISRDITERKRSEQAIQQLNVDLQKKAAQLEAANKELEAFSYSVSHDLRAPLRGIDGWSLALLEDYHDALDEQGRQYLDRVRSETQRMGQLIDDMLQLARVTRAEMRQEPVNLSAIAQVLAARLQEAEPGRQVEFNIQLGLSARGDASLLEAVLSNLLSNAFKFTSQRAQARIEFGQTEAQSQGAFFVRDNGAGFDMAYAQRLFGAFQRLHKASEFPGTGIGLATVQRVIHRHGGRVWVEAGVNQGATFYFTLEAAV